MANNRRHQSEDANVQGTGSNVNPVNPSVPSTPTSFFDQFDAPEEETQSSEDIIKALVTSGAGKLVKDVHIRNVVVNTSTYDVDGKTMYDTAHTFVTFVADKPCVIGDVRNADKIDSFGEPTIELGRTKNIITSLYAVSAVMKNNPKTAVFAPRIIDDPYLLERLFAGASLDVCMQRVVANEDYVNPFSPNAEAVSWDRDRIVHHITSLSLGEVGRDMYTAMLTKFM